jgi:hypothetical protein
MPWQVVLILLGLVHTASVVQGEDNPAGGHPLNREKRPSLEELLNSPDWGSRPSVSRPKAKPWSARPEEQPVDPNVSGQGPQVFRPEATTLPAPHVDSSDASITDDPVPEAPHRPAQRGGAIYDTAVVREFEELVAHRHRILNQVAMFKTLPEIFRQEDHCGRLWVGLQQCLSVQRKAAGNVDQVMAIGGKAAPGARERALRDFQDAKRATEAVHAEWTRETEDLQALYQRVHPTLADWFECYQHMRSLLPPDHRDQNRGLLLGILKQEIQNHNDFPEGRVLAALAEVYDGKTESAKRSLDLAIAELKRFRLEGTAFADDARHACLLLHQPERLNEFAAQVRKFDPARQTAVRCWLVGCYGMLLCRDGEADTYFQKAAAKVKVFSEGPPLVGAEPLLGDAALFWLTASQETKRNVEKARKVLARAPAECDDWRVVRAAAALAAADGDWDKAIELVDKCGIAAPPTIDVELAAQRNAYSSQEIWIRQRPGAAAKPPAQATP